MSTPDQLFEELILTKITQPGEMPWADHYHHSLQHEYIAYRAVDFAYVNAEGKLHRLYGPAYCNKTYNLVKWYKEGKLHREDGPAVTHNENLFWYFEGKLHNLTGPAVISKGGPKEYWIHGQKLPPKEFKKEIARRKRKGLM